VGECVQYVKASVGVKGCNPEIPITPGHQERVCYSNDGRGGIEMVDILLNVLQPFNDVTSTSLEPSIHEVFRLYNWIFDEIEKSRDLFLREPLDPVSIGRLGEALLAAEV
jgi:hypothetical protein